jgi:hypothetical protein
MKNPLHRSKFAKKRKKKKKKTEIHHTCYITKMGKNKRKTLIGVETNPKK